MTTTVVEVERRARKRGADFFLALLCACSRGLIFANQSHGATGKPSGGLVREIAKVCDEEPASDDGAMERLIRKLEPQFVKAALLPWHYRGQLLEAAMDKSLDFRVWGFAALALQESRSKKNVKPLVGLFLDASESPYVRAGAARGLKRHGEEPEVRSALEKVLKNETGLHPRVLEEAMGALVGTGTEEIELLLKLTDYPAKDLNQAGGVNFNAIRALARSRHPEAIEALFGLLDKYPPNSLLRRVVLDQFLHLAEMDEGRFRPWSEKLGDQLLKMTYEEKFGDGALNLVLQLLGKTRDKRAVDRLIELMEDRHQDFVVPWRAAEALGDIGDPRALPNLERLWESLPGDSRNRFELQKRLERWRKEKNPDQFIDGINGAINKLKKAEGGR